MSLLASVSRVRSAIRRFEYNGEDTAAVNPCAAIRLLVPRPKSDLEMRAGFNPPTTCPNFRHCSDAPRDDFPVTVQRDLPCPVFAEKIFRLRRRANQKYNRRRLIPSRGDVGHRHERWDGMRWTRQRRARLGLQGGSSVSDCSASDERRLSPAKPLDAPKSDFGRRRLAKTGGCVRQNCVVLAPVAGVKLPVTDAIQPDCFGHQAGSDGDKTNSSPGRAQHKP